MLIEEALEMFLLQLEADGRSQHTIRQYRRHVRLLAAWAAQEGHSGDVGEIDHQDVARFLAAPDARTRPDGASKKPASMNALRSSVRGFFAFLHRAGLIAQDPSRLVRPALCASAPPRGLTEAEQERLLAALDQAQTFEDRRDRLLFRTMLQTGLRLGSGLGLNVSDVDVEAGELSIRAKGNQDQRVFMPEGLARELGAWIDGLADPTGPVFTTLGGRRLSNRHAQRRFKTWLQRAEVRREASTHALRHSFGQRIYRETGDILLTKRALTHASINATMIYVQVDEDRLRHVIETV